jgi:condensin complex subunit 1
MKIECKRFIHLYGKWKELCRFSLLLSDVLMKAFRKSSSIAGLTKKRLIDALCKSVHSLCRILVDFASSNNDGQVSQEFRAAFAFHLYMLFSVMFFVESEAKGTNGLDRRADNKVDNAERDILRACCAQAMLTASQVMCKHRSYLWQRGVADEAVALLPCRIAYQMLESATGVVARKAASGDAALEMLTATIDSSEHLLSTIVAALVDLLHAYEHIAPLVAELCCMVNENPTNRLAVELIREIGRLNPAGGEGAKASGIRNLTPFISDIARLRPRIVLTSVSQILPHLDSEPYSLRSAIVTAIGHILVYIGAVGDAPDNEDTSSMDLSKSQNALLDILCDRALDVSSFTRGAVLKAWISIVTANALPIERLMSVTTLAADRLRDKTVVVRRSAMQVIYVGLLCCVVSCSLRSSPSSVAFNSFVGAQSFPRFA